VTESKTNQPQVKLQKALMYNTCNVTVEIGVFGVYVLPPIVIVDLGKSSTDIATANVPLDLWFEGNDIVQVF
jgi:hypothetical protein